jgi:hypothetical protein
MLALSLLFVAKILFLMFVNTIFNVSDMVLFVIVSNRIIEGNFFLIDMLLEWSRCRQIAEYLICFDNNPKLNNLSPISRSSPPYSNSSLIHLLPKYLS